MAATERTLDPVNVEFAIATPPATVRANPQSTALAIPAGNLLAVEVYIPPGHMGTTGFALTLSGATIVPYNSMFPWIIGDNSRLVLDVEMQVDTKLSAVTFNEGNYTHTHYLRLVIRSIQQRSGFAPVSLVANESLTP